MVPRRMFSFPLVQACFASLGFQETFPTILSVFRPPYKHKSLKTDQEKWAGLAFEGKNEEQDSPKGTHTHTHTRSNIRMSVHTFLSVYLCLFPRYITSRESPSSSANKKHGFFPEPATCPRSQGHSPACAKRILPSAHNWEKEGEYVG